MRFLVDRTVVKRVVSDFDDPGTHGERLGKGNGLVDDKIKHVVQNFSRVCGENTVGKAVATGRSQRRISTFGRSQRVEPIAKIECISAASTTFVPRSSSRVVAGDRERGKER